VRLLIEPHDRQLVGLNNDSGKPQKSAQRGKRRRLKAATKAGLRKKVVTQHESDVKTLGAAVGPPPSQSQHGRLIKLPAKYR
jgi:hypothetical protein